MTERDMEDQIAADPERFLGEPGLTLAARQYSIGPYRFDLLFADRHGGKLIVEIQKGTLDRQHAYKILDYYFEYRDANPTEFIDVMVVANQITLERKKRLHDFGVAFREIPESEFVTNPVTPKDDVRVVLPASRILTQNVADTTDQKATEESTSHSFRSLGPSAFVDAVRDAISRDPSLGRWKLGGRSSLTGIFQPAKELLDNRYSRGFSPQLWMERPKAGSASCKFEVAYAIPSLSTEENSALRESIAASLRSKLAGQKLPEGVVLATGSTVVKCVVPVNAINDIADDMGDVVGMYAGQISQILAFVQFLDPILSAWAADNAGLSGKSNKQ